MEWFLFIYLLLFFSSFLSVLKFSRVHYISIFTRSELGVTSIVIHSFWKSGTEGIKKNENRWIIFNKH